MSAGYRKVEFTKEELITFAGRADQMILDRLHSLGVPVNGVHQFEGVRYGVMRVAYDPENDKRIIEWWETKEAALADGVDLKPEEQNVPNTSETQDGAGDLPHQPLVLPGDAEFDSRFGNR